MVTQNAMKALCIRAELVLWKGRRSIYGARWKALKSEYVLKKDVVERMGRSVLKHFSLFSGNYEDKLAKEKWEVDEAKKAYEQIVCYISEGEKRISELERQAEGLKTEGTCFDNKVLKSSSSTTENGFGITRTSLIHWCELVEEASALANGITSFLEDLVVCIERSNSSKARSSELMRIEISASEIDEKGNSFFKRLQQEYGKTDLWKNIKHINAQRMLLTGEGRNGVQMQENALLYTIQKEMEELQKLLVETFALVEDDGERLLKKLKKECSDTGNLVTDERDKIEEKSSVKNVFTDHLENKYEKQEEIFSSYAGNKFDIQQKDVFLQEEFKEQENINKERDELLEGMRLLRQELKSVGAEMQKGFKKNRGSLFGKHREHFDEGIEVPVEIKKLECAIEVWRGKLKGFRRKARHFPCALDGFISMESREIGRGFENEEAVTRQVWYLTYLDELETRMKTVEQQLVDFRIDA